MLTWNTFGTETINLSVKVQREFDTSNIKHILPFVVTYNFRHCLSILTTLSGLYSCHLTFLAFPVLAFFHASLSFLPSLYRPTEGMNSPWNPLPLKPSKTLQRPAKLMSFSSHATFITQNKQVVPRTLWTLLEPSRTSCLSYLLKPSIKF